jgi:4'-phosphopantetheinyl transferase
MCACAATEISINIFSMPGDDVLSLRLPRMLTPDEVHVWKLCGGIPLDSLEGLRQLLSQEERQRAERFRFPADQGRFVASRGMLRHLLGGYLGCNARHVRFRYSERGKPELEFNSGMDLRFNVAHSGDAILWAFTRVRRIGIDVEKVRVDLNVSEIAERFFSLAERAELISLPDSQQHEAFFRCWTRKEAYLKATGDGLSLPLDEFDVSISAAKPPRLLETRPDHFEATRWTMHSIDVGPAYASALVVERKNP